MTICQTCGQTIKTVEKKVEKGTIPVFKRIGNKSYLSRRVENKYEPRVKSKTGGKPNKRTGGFVPIPPKKKGESVLHRSIRNRSQ